MAEKKEEKAEAKEEVKKEEPKKEEKKEKSKAAPKKKKTKLLDKAKETIEEARKKEPEQKFKDTRVKGKPRIYTVPLKTKNTRNAVSSLKDFVKKHVKAEDVTLDQKLNEKLWVRGRKKPPRKIRVEVSQDETGRARVELK